MAAPSLKMYRSDTMAEVGTDISPIDFGLCDAGETTLLAYEIILYNDKTGALGSDDARSLIVQLLGLSVTEMQNGTGAADQTRTVAYIPVESNSEEVTVNGTKWTRVDDFTASGPTSMHYTFNYTTGVLLFGNGARGICPPIGTNNIVIIYIPAINTYGAEVYENLWISMRSDGVIANSIHIDTELGARIDNTHVQVVHAPKITSVIGVWANSGKTGTNYYTGGTYDTNTGVITLGTSYSGSTPYVEYYYEIKDDAESGWTALGKEVSHSLLYLIPKNNAKRIYLKVTVPDTASTEGGAYIQVRIKVSYTY